MNQDQPPPQERPKFPAKEAFQVAAPLRLALQQVCERVEIAGSLRRRKPMVSDIELLFVPKFRDTGADMFKPTPVSLVDELLKEWLKDKLIGKRPNCMGVEAWGEKNKLSIHLPSGIPIDFFATTEENWWNSLVVRTGGKEHNLRITKEALKHGHSFEAYGAGFRKLGTQERIPMHSEEEIFQFLRLPYLQPWERP